jgi:hypothetical protein
MAVNTMYEHARQLVGSARDSLLVVEKSLPEFWTLDARHREEEEEKAWLSFSGGVHRRMSMRSLVIDNSTFV